MNNKSNVSQLGRIFLCLRCPCSWDFFMYQYFKTKVHRIKLTFSDNFKYFWWSCVTVRIVTYRYEWIKSGRSFVSTNAALQFGRETCTRNSWQEVFIRTMKQFPTNADMISDAVHLQFCSQNLVTKANSYYTVFGKLPNGQTSICAHQGVDFINLWVVSSHWRTPRTLIVLNGLSATLEAFKPLETSCTLQGNITVSHVEHGECFSCRFPEIYTKFHCNSLLIQAVHFTIRQTKKDSLLKTV